ncbi:MAG: DEAD/DEAH box helicase family protein, partial [Acidobacteriota bacterium]|nr:DEAD/DEAH box helicase family protein [Acidobacteriota bacterium]
YNSAAKAENLVRTDPGTACFHARRALELAVDWIYQYDDELRAPYDNNLSSKIFADDFRDNLPRNVFVKVDYIRRIGNEAVHSHRRITEQEALQTAKELFHFLYWMARSYTKGTPAQFDGLQFNETLVPQKQVSVPAQTYEQLKKVYQVYKQTKTEEAERKRRIAEPTIDEELERLRKQITAAKKRNERFPDAHDYSEADTRKHIIDLMIREAGWTLGSDATVELEVTGMPNAEGIGYVDYVLWGNDGKPLAVVEAKRTSAGAEVGKQQAKEYANCIEQMFGVRPIIFYTNGYEIFLWDDANYPPRNVQGFYTKDELVLMIQRRTTRQTLNADDINTAIVERYYQKRAIKKVAENFSEKNQRKALVVMATGAGKTRTVIALCDLLQRANWAKRILFLADRVALVKQAANAFKTHLPNSNPVNLVTEREETGSRVYVSTYPTMMNLINQMDGEKRRFGVGYFDLIIVDEAHRSIYQKYKAIFDYFDSFLVGLTATPKSEVDKNTYRLFDLQSGVPTDAYELEEAVRDGYLVPSVNISVPTKFTREGIKYDELSEEDKDRWDEIEWNEEGEIPDQIDATALNQWLFNENTIDLVLKYLMENGLKVEGGDKLGKTIIFAKNHKHAIEIEKRFDANYLHLKGEFARVIDNYATYTEKLIDDFSTPAKLPQIAVSVDMLDTGIDIPEIVNLVFFKTVRSKTKFLQMIGRGTRLRPNLFAPGEDKEFFYIFDYCQNFEYFNQEKKEIEPRLQESLSTKLFHRRVELIDTIRKTPERDEQLEKLNEEVTERLQLEVEAINPNNFVVRPHLREVEKFNDKKAWEKIDAESYWELTQIIAALPNELKPEDETAKRFDFLILKTQLAVLQNHKHYEKLKEQVIEIARLLEEKENVPKVKAQIELIQEMQKDEFWQDTTLPMLENVRKRLRDLIINIDRVKRQNIYTDFDDVMGEGTETEFHAVGINLIRYRKKMMQFLADEENNIVLQKLKRNKPITPSDISELERIFFESGDFGTKEDFENAYGKQVNLGLFIRSLVGLDRQEAKRAFNDFLDGQKYNSNQIEFVNMVIDYLTKNGVMDAALLYQPPYTNYNSNGLSGIFSDDEATNFVEILESIKLNAAA